MDITAGGDFLSLCDQKSSYKHVYDFGRLRSYGHLLIPVHDLVLNRVLRNQLTGTQLGGLLFAEAATSISRSSQPSGSLCCGRRWHFRKPALSTDQFKLNVISRT